MRTPPSAARYNMLLDRISLLKLSNHAESRTSCRSFSSVCAVKHGTMSVPWSTDVTKSAPERARSRVTHAGHATAVAVARVHRLPAASLNLHWYACV